MTGEERPAAAIAEIGENSVGVVAEGTKLEDFLNQCFATITGADEVSRQGIRHLQEALDWDWPDEGAELGADPVVPLSTYLTFAMPAYRERGDILRPGKLPPLPVHWLPLPGSRSMGVTVEVEAGTPMRIHDRLASHWYLRKIRSTRTRLGPALFLDFEAHFKNQDGDQVAVERLTLLNFEPAEGVGADESQRQITADPVWEAPPRSDFDARAPQIGALLADVVLPVSRQRQAMIHSANRDFAPIHHDPWAASEIGSPEPVLSTMSLLSLVERLATDNGGPGTRAIRLGPLRLHRPTPSVSVVRVRGQVVGVEAAEGGSLVDLQVAIGTEEHGVTATGGARFFFRS